MRRVLANAKKETNLCSRLTVELNSVVLHNSEFGSYRELINLHLRCFISSVLKEKECVETCILECGTHFIPYAFRKPTIHMIHAWPLYVKPNSV